MDAHSHGWQVKTKAQKRAEKKKKQLEQKKQGGAAGAQKPKEARGDQSDGSEGEAPATKAAPAPAGMLHIVVSRGACVRVCGCASGDRQGRRRKNTDVTWVDFGY